MKDKTSAQLSHLELVFPPITNSSVSTAAKKSEIVEILRESDFYMIGGRAAATISVISCDADADVLHFEIVVNGGPSDKGFIRLDKIPRRKDDRDWIGYAYRAQTHRVDVYLLHQDESTTLIAALDPDTILWRRGRREDVVGGLDNYRELATYDLLYVGIAKTGDSYDRLIDNGHKARMQILSDEPQRFPGARVSDEIFLFLYKAEPLLIRTFGGSSEIEDVDLDFSYDNKRIVADAEKAFISILKPKYNNVLYKSYPRGRDGLYGSGLDSYSYSIAEGMTFRTAYGAFKGAREHLMPLSNDADFIHIKGNDVTLHISGADFNVQADTDESSLRT